VCVSVVIYVGCVECVCGCVCVFVGVCVFFTCTSVCVHVCMHVPCAHVYLLRTDCKPDWLINGTPVYKPVPQFVIQSASF